MWWRGSECGGGEEGKQCCHRTCAGQPNGEQVGLQLVAHYDNEIFLGKIFLGKIFLAHGFDTRGVGQEGGEEAWSPKHRFQQYFANGHAQRLDASGDGCWRLKIEVPMTFC